MIKKREKGIHKEREGKENDRDAFEERWEKEWERADIPNHSFILFLDWVKNH